MDEKAIECLQRYKKGDIQALGRLVEHYRRPLYGFILRMTEGKTDADEIFQEVWLRAIKRLESFRKGNFLSWLFRIAHNLIIDQARVAKRKVELNDGEDDARSSWEDGITDGGLDPSGEILEKEIGERVKKAVNLLPAEQREVFLMRVDGDLTFKEIAGIQGVSINTALARMQYALDKLRQHLKGFYAK